MSSEKRVRVLLAVFFLGWQTYLWAPGLSGIGGLRGSCGGGDGGSDTGLKAQLKTANSKIQRLQEQLDLATGVLRDEFAMIGSDQICKEPALYTQNGDPNSPDTAEVCQRKCSEAHPVCVYMASWPDRGCRHWGPACTPVHAPNGPVLYKHIRRRVSSAAAAAQPPMAPVQAAAGALSPAAPAPDKATLIPIVVLCYNRANYLRRTLSSILDSRPAADAARFPVFVSKQGQNTGVNQVLEEFSNRIDGVNQYVWSDNGKRKSGFEGGQWLSYYKISQHYQSALGWVFAKGMSRVVVMEDDLRISPDFFEYFSALAPVYDADPTMFCVSAWNDNGMASVVQDPARLHRTDVFPGLGWMLNRRVWDELRPKWPLAFWDDWMREKSQPNGRSCVFPEVNRVYTFGDRGNSVDNTFWTKYLKPIRLNDQFTRFSTLPLKDSITMPAYARALAADIMRGAEASATQFHTVSAPVAIVTYRDMAQFREIAQLLGIQTELKEGDPRASFRHVNSIFARGKRAYVIQVQVYQAIKSGNQDWYVRR